MSRALLAFAVSITVLGFVSPHSEAQESPTPVAPAPANPVVEGRILHLPSGASFELGCEGRAVARQGDSIFVACGADGVIGIDASNSQTPRRAGTMTLDSGEATGLLAPPRRAGLWELSVICRCPSRTASC